MNICLFIVTLAMLTHLPSQMTNFEEIDNSNRYRTAHQYCSVWGDGHRPSFLHPIANIINVDRLVDYASLLLSSSIGHWMDLLRDATIHTFRLIYIRPTDPDRSVVIYWSVSICQSMLLFYEVCPPSVISTWLFHQKVMFGQKINEEWVVDKAYFSLDMCQSTAHWRVLGSHVIPWQLLPSPHMIIQRSLNFHFTIDNPYFRIFFRIQIFRFFRFHW